MLDNKPLSRRFAVDFSARNALEFMEFLSFDDGKMIVMFRQFLHTHDLSLPVVACARLHASSRVEQTLGPIIMRADLLEAPRCPSCSQVGRQCQCSFESYAPNGTVSKATYTWNQFASRFMHKARLGTVKLRITAVLPNVGEMRIMDDDIAVVNVMQRGQTEYMSLLRRKAVHGLGINVVMPRSEAFVLSTSVENDFIDLHNSYVSRKHARDVEEDDPSSVLLEPAVLDITGTGPVLESSPNGAAYSDTIESADDNLYMFPDILNAGDSPGHPADIAAITPILGAEVAPVVPDVTSILDPFGKEEPFVNRRSTCTSNQTASLQAPNTTGSPAQTDILNDIEDIISPPGSLLHSQGDAVNGPAPPEPPLDLLDSTPVGQYGGNRTSAIASEHSTTHVTNSGTAYAGPAKRKKRTKSQPHGDSGTDVEKKNACNTCSARFKMRGDLLRHIALVHQKKKMYNCQACGKAFGHSGHLNRHFKSKHLNERRFKCQICGFRFFQQSHLQSHIGHIHGAKKAFSCQECGYRAQNKSALTRHMDESHAEPKSEPTSKPTQDWSDITAPENVAQVPSTDVGYTFAFDGDLGIPAFPNQQMGSSFAADSVTAQLSR